MHKVARVFPSKTKMSPLDLDAYFGEPDFFTPRYDEIHISTVFTWDISKANQLAKAWRHFGKVRVGGPAFGDKGGKFMAGRYLRKGVTITSRGCPNSCAFCVVPGREGKIRELPIMPGNVVQDNNLLACSKKHVEKVFCMLRKQRGVDFAGGFESDRVTDRIVDELANIHIAQIWLAMDTCNAEKSLKKAVGRLSRIFYHEVERQGKIVKIPNRYKLRCYVLAGWTGDTVEKAEARLRRAWEIGTTPFIMLYKGREEEAADRSRAWKELRRTWSRPAAIRTVMQNYDLEKLKNG